LQSITILKEEEEEEEEQEQEQTNDMETVGLERASGGRGEE
jgi:hypothetical protein